MAHYHQGTVIPFSFFGSLLRELGEIKQRAANAPKKAEEKHLQVLNRWLKELHAKYDPLPTGTTAIFFRLLFPDEDIERKYHMQEPALVKALTSCFNLGHDRAKRLSNWESTSDSLGLEVQKIVEATRTSSEDAPSSLSLVQVDTLLTELASRCKWSSTDVRNAFDTDPRSRSDIIRDLFTPLIPLDAFCVTQIILKDLRPVIYPILQAHYTINLSTYNSTAIHPLTKFGVMKAWAGGEMGLINIYRSLSRMNVAAAEYESGDPSAPVCPRIGTPVEIPKAIKGRGCVDSLGYFSGHDTVWAETKYDGERAQIHVAITGRHASEITIFSKSKRDSTLDRAGVHRVLRQALGLVPTKWNPRFTKNVILEAEMVAFSDTRNCIDEFWRIRSLVAATAQGPRAMMGRAQIPDFQCQESQSSMMSDGDAQGTRRLALVFFECLMVDDTSCLRYPYHTRRQKLKSLIEVTHGEALLAKSTPISLRSKDPNESGQCGRAEEELRTLFASTIARSEEGLMLKAHGGTYHFPSWVKLKRDYIEGYGDALDLVVVGARWDKQRGRELRVNTDTFTTFYLGVLTDKGAGRSRPHFEVYFDVAYGMNRDQLEEINALVKYVDTVEYCSGTKDDPRLKYTFELSGGLNAPTVMLCTPLLVELFGAGFQKPEKCLSYALRWPRLIKVHGHNDRSWTECMHMDELNKVAHQVVGRESYSEEADAWAKKLFNPAPEDEDWARKQREVKAWEKKLEDVDSSAFAAMKRGRMMDMSAPQPLKRRKTDAGPTIVLDDTPPPPPSHARRVHSSPALTTMDPPSIPVKKWLTLPVSARRTTQVTENPTSLLQAPIVLPSLTRQRTRPPLEHIKRAQGPASVRRETCASFSEQPFSPTPPLSSPARLPLLPAHRSPLKPAFISSPYPRRVVHHFKMKVEETDTDMEEIGKFPAAELAPGNRPPSVQTPPSAYHIPVRTQSLTTPAAEKLVPTLVRSSSMPDLTLPMYSNIKPEYLHKPIVRFMWMAFIWLEPSEHWPKKKRPSRRSVVPRNYISSFDSFLKGCGWDLDEPSSSTSEDRGVIFANLKENAQPTKNMITRLNERRNELNAQKNRTRKPIYIFDMTELDYEMLKRGCQDVLSRAIQFA